MQYTDRDREILRLYGIYPNLPANFMRALFPPETSVYNFRDRLMLMTRRHDLIMPSDQKWFVKARKKFRVRQLKGAQHPNRLLLHGITESISGASFEIAAKQHGLEYVPWEEIAENPRTPKATLNSPEPFKITVPFEGRQRFVIPDFRPFVLRGPAGAKCFVGLEADCKSEDQTSSKGKLATIEEKLKLYLAFTEQEIYKSHYGFPNALIPIITTAPKRRSNMEGILYDLTKGKGSPNIIFKDIPDFRATEQVIHPFEDWLSGWRRVGHKDMDLLAELTGKKAA